ncbi:MAG: bifunctional alpha/beta hydrolase/OsmC family protein, partial [Bacteroidota bacterium]
MRIKKVSFQNHNGYQLSAIMQLPADRHPVACAIFAHVFTGNKNLKASRNVSRALTQNGIGVLRFDFTGLGESEGDFADTTFTSNVEDILAAANFLEAQYEAPEVLIGHSLGGAAVIFAAQQLPSIKAVATIGAPSEPEHVSHLLEDSLEKIQLEGKAKVNIGGQIFTIKKSFLDDLREKQMFQVLKKMKKALLVLHSPQDRIVEIENAAQIYHAAFHPKSFITLDGADHMLTNKKEAAYAGEVIASWVSRYLDLPQREKLRTAQQVVVRLDDESGCTSEVLAGHHHFLADEPEEVGGNDFGPDPYELLSASLGACTAMTLRMYAKRKKWPLEEVTVHLNHAKKHYEDCMDCEEKNQKIDYFERHIELEGPLSEEQKQR